MKLCGIHGVWVRYIDVWKNTGVGFGWGELRLCVVRSCL